MLLRVFWIIRYLYSDFTEFICLESGLVEVCIIDDNALDIRFCCYLAAQTKIQLSENRVGYTSPIDVAVVHETIEDILILFIMVDMLFIALLASWLAKYSWISPIIYLFLFMGKGNLYLRLAILIK